MISGPAKLRKYDPGGLTQIASSSCSQLWSSDKIEEQNLECGKVQNLRVAAKKLDGLLIPGNTTFSLWQAIGKPTRKRGFVPGRQIQEGCVIPSTGGGLCQLSNALYLCATNAGLEIIERHAHTMIFPGSAAEMGKDATIAWNHIDLRFRAKSDILLRVCLTSTDLRVDFMANEATSHSFVPVLTDIPKRRKVANSCETCGDVRCFRHLALVAAETQTAWLLDSVTPELKQFVRLRAKPEDWVLTPIGPPFPVPYRFHWNIAGPKAKHATIISVWRALKLRRHAMNGPVRRQILLDFDQKLAEQYQKSLDPRVKHIMVDISLLAPLWKSGALGGRTFSVLITRWPLNEIHRLFDEASQQFPTRKLLSDFRAPADLVNAETTALGHATEIVTAHPEIVRLFPGRCFEMEWDVRAGEHKTGNEVIFIGPTMARKGCYEVRSAARELGLHLKVGGSSFENEDFWEDIDTGPLATDWISTAGLILAPSLMEDRPQALLKAYSMGIPIITTKETGIPPADHVTFVPFGDSEAIKLAILEWQKSSALNPKVSKSDSEQMVFSTHES
jgi:glycosyltransferase involved in cell wall biosynthesis